MTALQDIHEIWCNYNPIFKTSKAGTYQATNNVIIDANFDAGGVISRITGRKFNEDLRKS